MKALKTGQWHRGGFSLTEIAIVLAIIGLVLGAIWVGAKAVMGANRADVAVQDISTIAANVRSSFMAQNAFTLSGNQTAAMITAGVIPNDLLTATGSTKNSWGGTVAISLGTPDARHFRVSFYGTPPDACYRIASQLTNIGTSDAPTQLLTASGGGSQMVANATSGPNSSCPSTTIGLCSSAITTACALNSTTSTASTEFDFVIH